ncbi:MAG: c-type cytochrome, partial [Gemmatimonadota bacterium]
DGTVGEGSGEQATVPVDTLPAGLRKILDEGQQAFLRSGCIACHRIAGTPAAGVLGPDLTHVGGRRTIAAGILENTPENMAAWLRDPPKIKPGSLMPDMNLDEDTIRTLVAYLESLK